MNEFIVGKDDTAQALEVERKQQSEMKPHATCTYARGTSPNAKPAVLSIAPKPAAIDN